MEQFIESLGEADGGDPAAVFGQLFKLNKVLQDRVNGLKTQEAEFEYLKRVWTMQIQDQFGALFIAAETKIKTVQYFLTLIIL